jgi:hypothetical protein
MLASEFDNQGKFLGVVLFSEGGSFPEEQRGPVFHEKIGEIMVKFGTHQPDVPTDLEYVLRPIT